jgi:hypothetical protein
VKERTFTETEVRRLLWLIGYVTPLSGLARTYQGIYELLHDSSRDVADAAPLLRMARGVWCDANSYGVGDLRDPDCDIGTKGQARLACLIEIEKEIEAAGEQL